MGSKNSTKKPLRVRLTSKERLNFFTDLSTMLSAGIPILEAFESLEFDSKGRVKKVLRELRASLANGEPLSRGMKRLPKAFDPVTINLIEAAEMGGTLEETLEDLVKITDKEITFSSTIRTTMVYPLFVMVIFTAILILMLTFVIPRVAKVFVGMRVHMPPVTRAMISASNFFVHNWLYIIAGAVVFFVLLAMIVTLKKRAIVRLILSLPGLKALGRHIDLARFTRSFALLLKAGVPLEQSLELSKRVVQKKQIVSVIEQMRVNINAGKPLSSNLRGSKTVPPMMVRSIETAEASGTLEKTMQHLSEYFEKQVEQNLKVLSSLIEPILLLVVGVLVGGLMITIIAPIYNLISQVSPKQ